MKKELTEEQKRLDADLWIIAITTMVAFGIYAVIGSSLMAFCRDSSISVWPRLLAAAAMEFAIAGLGITIVCLLRKESFTSFGLRRQNLLKAIGGTILCFLPYIIYVVCTGQFTGYKPLTIMVSDDLYKSGAFAAIVGTLIIAVVWGFFEGFNYAVICELINRRYPSKGLFPDWGALVCALMCILFHPFSFSALGLVEIATTFIAIYGMLLVKRATGNSWGCVFAFLFIWNAL